MGWGRLRATPQRWTPVRNPPGPGSAKPTLSSREATLPRRVPADHLLTPPCGEGITFSLPLAGKGRGGGVLMREPSWRSALVLSCRRLLTRLMQLNVPAAQCVARRIPGRERDCESVHPPTRLAIVCHICFVRSGCAVDISGALDVPGGRAGPRVRGHASPVDLEPGVVVEVLEVSPEGAILDAARDREGRLATAALRDDPPSTGDEILPGAAVRLAGAGDIRVHPREAHVGQGRTPDWIRDHDFECGDIDRVGSAALLVDVDGDRRNAHGLVRRPANCDGLTVDG